MSDVMLDEARVVTGKPDDTGRYLAAVWIETIVDSVLVIEFEKLMCASYSKVDVGDLMTIE